MKSVAIVPAAGKSERYAASTRAGQPQKLLVDLAGEPMIDRTIRSLLAGGVDRVIVVRSPAADFSTARMIADPRVEVVTNPDPSRGMLSSIQAGVAVADGDPILVLPGDMPYVRSETVAAVLQASRAVAETVHGRADVFIPIHAGRHGHPIGISGLLRQAILAAPTSSNLGDVLKAPGLTRRDVEVDDAGVLRDVDVERDLMKEGA
jgi:molybdenum cofactor cytidylyltransferase